MSSLESRAKEIFLDALEHEGAARDAFLSRACADDLDLRRRVLQLLASHQPSAMDVVTTGPADLGPGMTIGNYRLISQLGEGGFGAVFLAEQERPVKRQVALKILKLGMDTKRVIARFEQERQALARMDHPNIAKVHDAGSTASGRPFFVMELVAGEPITKFCADRAASLDERLGLFHAVCLAVHHAHQKGIIHRDLKPANVLVADVDGVAVPKVIDFGVAKAIEGDLTPHSVLTREHQAIGTPAYMSPEQMRGDSDVDTRSDVYALGVVLFQILTDALPFDPASTPLDQFRSSVLEDEPPRPSARLKHSTDPSRDYRVPRELDWIVLHCLAKDRDNRYSSAAALAEDVDRLLHDQPIVAAPPSAWYRLRKLVRRNRTAAIASALVVLALVAGAVATTRGYIEARRQTRLANAINDFLTHSVLPAALPSSQPGRGRDVTMRAVLDSAAERIEKDPSTIDGFRDDPLIEAGIRFTIGDAYLGLGMFKEAEAHFARAEALRRATLGDDDPATLCAIDVRATALRQLGRFDDAANLLREELAAKLREFGERSFDVATVRMGLALTLSKRGDRAEAIALCRTILASVPDDESIENQRIRHNVGVALSECGERGEAEALIRRALEVERTQLGLDEPGVLQSTINFATTLSGVNDQEARRILEDVLPRARRILGDEHQDVLIGASTYGGLLVRANEIDAADALLTPALATARERLGPRQLTTLHLAHVLSMVREQQDRYPEAEALTREALEIASETIGENQILTIVLLNDLAHELGAQDKDSELEPILRRALAAAEAVFPKGDPRVAMCRENLVRHLRRSGREDDARAVESAADAPAAEKP